MAQDLRKLLEKDRERGSTPMKAGHKKRFQQRLENRFPRQRKSWAISLKIAASIVILAGIGSYFISNNSVKTAPKITVVEKDEVVKKEGISLGDLSPDLKKVENYYVANINYELSKLQVLEENRSMVEGFMDQLATLNTEYKRLNAELNRMGPNDQTITALIKNLQLRLQLLQRLKEKINQLKSSKNEAVETQNV